jgi:hypothetical protein
MYERAFAIPCISGTLTSCASCRFALEKEKRKMGGQNGQISADSDSTHPLIGKSLVLSLINAFESWATQPWMLL